MKIASVTNSTRRLGDSGGVALFAEHLHKALDCDVLSRGEYEKVRGKYDIVIADGYLAGEVNDGKCKVISVIHGSIKEFAIRNDKVNDNLGPILWQEHTWNNPKIIKVAVSESAAFYAQQHHGCTVDKVIPNGVDLTEFKPMSVQKSPEICIIHVGTDYNKTAGMKLEEIAKRLRPKYAIKSLDARIGEAPLKFNEGDIFVHVSRYEGNSYACLEALATGLPIVCSNTGLFESHLGETSFGHIVSWKESAQTWEYMIESVIANRQRYNPRAFAEKYSLEKFCENWRQYIKEIC